MGIRSQWAWFWFSLPLQNRGTPAQLSFFLTGSSTQEGPLLKSTVWAETCMKWEKKWGEDLGRQRAGQERQCGGQGTARIWPAGAGRERAGGDRPGEGRRGSMHRILFPSAKKFSFIWSVGEIHWGILKNGVMNNVISMQAMQPKIFCYFLNGNHLFLHHLFQCVPRTHLVKRGKKSPLCTYIYIYITSVAHKQHHLELECFYQLYRYSATC